MKMNKKGFTIVELVIVIAVIAILAGVMIPTFGGVIDTANKSAEQQEATNAYKAMAAQVASVKMGKTFTDATFYIAVDKYIYVVNDTVVDYYKENTTENVEAITTALYVETAAFGVDGVKIYAQEAVISAYNAAK